jgi:hypothetical protein
VSTDELEALLKNVDSIERLTYINPASCSRDAYLKSLLPDKFGNSESIFVGALVILVALI